MITIKRLVGRGGLLATALAFGAAVVVPALLPNGVVGATGQYTSRSLSLSSSNDGNTSAGGANSGTDGASAEHTFSFKVATTGNVGSYLFEYCTTPLLDTACTAPTGMDASSAVISGSLTGFAATAPTLDTTTTATSSGTVGSKFQVNTGAEACSGTAPGRTNCILLKRGTAASETLNTTLTAAFTGIKNPTSNGPFYVRIYSFSDTAYTNANIVDEAAVAGSINDTIDITAKVQEKLNFSVANAWVIPNATCDALTGGGALTLGTGGILDMTLASTNNSYFRLSTNSANGANVYYSGDTLKSAQGNSIAPLTASTASHPGSEQFGLGLDQGDTNYSLAGGSTGLTPAIGYTATASGTVTDSGTASFNYTNNALTVPVKIASSTGAVSCDTGSVRYIANIAPTTKAGIYTTSIAYIATSTF